MVLLVGDDEVLIEEAIGGTSAQSKFNMYFRIRSV